MQLLKHQQAAIDKLQRLRVGALFMEAGTGKTLTAYNLIQSANPDFVLWLCPFQLKAQTEKELLKYGSALNIAFVGLESISASDRIYLETRSMLDKHANRFIVIDESLKIKNADAIRTKRCLELAKLSEYRLVLNGTPITKNLMDIWAQFEFLSPNVLNMSYAQFKNTFVEYVELTKRSCGRTITTEIIRDYKNIEYLYSIINSYVFECALNLDVEREYETRHYILDREEQEEYDKLKRQYLDNSTLIAMRNNIFISMTTKMQHNYCCSERKFEVLDEIIKEEGAGNIIVFCKFLDSVYELTKRYPELEVLTYGKHAYGLNLQKYSVTVYWDKTFDYAQLVQSKHRTYRTGQERMCKYYSLTADTKLDTMVDENIGRKQSLLDYLKQVGNETMLKEL